MTTQLDKKAETKKHSTAHALLWAACLAAGCVGIIGFGLLWKYEQTPGAAAEAPAEWPSGSRIRHTPGRCCLVLALHPRCWCSQATLTELEEILNRCGDALEVHLLFYTPAGYGPDWAHTDLWDRAGAIPGVTRWIDEDGAEARLFGAATSGHAVLYGPNGRLLFRGGITGSRGHVGDNDGREAVIRHVLGLATDPTHTEVYGCPICEPHRDKATGASACGDMN